MYIPRRYQISDRPSIISFMKENSFAILVSVKDGLPIASHIPLAMETNAAGDDVLVGHISRGNDQKVTLTHGARVLCIFPGPHAYISPRWYTEMNVPTWNYLSVHAYGTIRIMEGEALKAALSRLVDKYEQHMPQPVTIGEIPEKKLHDDMRGIIGFDILIDDLQAVAKLSQNRDEKSFHNVIDALQQGDAPAQQVAAEMAARSREVFEEG